ncbi:MAG: hypothetical protein K6G10_10545 [Butyrivibrio sp.]|nr:hypothetical protein [Butyrivibrio sp.]
MKIQQNSEALNNQVKTYDETPHAPDPKKTVKKSGNTISLSCTNMGQESLFEQRQNYAKKQAMKVVADAFKGEKKLDAQMQSIKDEIKRLQDEIYEKTMDTKANNEKLQELREEYGIDPENPDLETMSDEEKEKYSEYQQKASFYIFSNQQNAADIERAKQLQAGNVQGYADMKSERAKSQDMLNAQNAAEDILDAANSETVTLLTKDAVDNIDEEQKQREEEAKEASEKKKEEKKEAAKKLEKEAMQQEVLENIREHATEFQKTGSDIKREVARRERAEAARMDAGDLPKNIISDTTSLKDTQDAVNTEITNILNRLSLLPSDVKGSAVDDQV